MYIYTEEVRLLLVTREHTYNSQMHYVQPILVPPSASTESVGEQASEIALCREIIALVCGAIRFLGSVLATVSCEWSH
jgi:hypothetical protein